MKIKDLVNYWDKHARGRLTRDAYFMALSDQHHKRLEKLAALYPMKSPQEAKLPCPLMTTTTTLRKKEQNRVQVSLTQMLSVFSFYGSSKLIR